MADYQLRKVLVVTVVKTLYSGQPVVLQKYLKRKKGSKEKEIERYLPALFAVFKLKEEIYGVGGYWSDVW